MAKKRGGGRGGNANTLRRYWNNRGTKKGKRSGLPWGAHGKGGDFYQCVGRVSKHMTTKQARGYCALRHREATGKWPGRHGNAHRSAKRG
jgi:hypothetical protein